MLTIAFFGLALCRIFSSFFFLLLVIFSYLADIHYAIVERTTAERIVSLHLTEIDICWRYVCPIWWLEIKACHVIETASAVCVLVQSLSCFLSIVFCLLSQYVCLFSSLLFVYQIPNISHLFVGCVTFQQGKKCVWGWLSACLCVLPMWDISCRSNLLSG